MNQPAMPAPDASHDTVIGRLARRWLADSCPSVRQESEQDTAGRCDRLVDALESLTKLPANDWADVDAKLIILSVRLRQAATTADPETMLLALLVTSIQHDLLRLRL
ncbi:hypothetical protein ABNQ38_04105 [Azospirillum sp. A29]|uniref:hypothetical protein n=1 Tax=Azospirillum sp. A29 TaxID=3160606 RepID=UPI003670529D